MPSENVYLINYICKKITMAEKNKKKTTPSRLTNKTVLREHDKGGLFFIFFLQNKS